MKRRQSEPVNMERKAPNRQKSDTKQNDSGPSFGREGQRHSRIRKKQISNEMSPYLQKIQNMETFF